MKTEIIKSNAQDKMSKVMREFKQGKLKTPDGKTVTDHKQALAIALSEAGLSKSELKKAEIKNKLIVLKKNIDNMIFKEVSDQKQLRHEIIKYFKENPTVSDKNGIHILADKLGVDPSTLEEQVYKILSSLISGGKSHGKEMKVDQKEFDQGMKVESEHTQDPDLRKKIVNDHLAEDPKYYSKLSAAKL